MKKIKAFVPASRAADLLEALRWPKRGGVGILNLTVFPVQAIRRGPASDAQYLIELATEVAPTVKVEILCEAAEVSRISELIKKEVGEGAGERGWVLVTPVLSAGPIGEDVL